MSKNINLKQFYTKEDILGISPFSQQPVSFFEEPRNSSQGFIGEQIYKLNDDEELDRTPYFANNYEYIKKLGDGSVAKLYLCKANSGSQENVIIKKISKNENWRTELNVLKTIKNNSKNLLELIDFFESWRYAYIVTKYYPGYDLFEHIDLNVPYSAEDANKILMKMALCIKECHDMSIAHLDIKCENFMVIGTDSVAKTDGLPLNIVLIDFGHAEIIPENKIVEDSSSYGTGFYLCPEGYNRVMSTKSDIWSLGICYYLLLTGDYPFEGSDDDEYAENVYRKKFKGPLNGEHNDLIPNGSKDIIEKMLNYDPRQRPTISEVIGLLMI